MQLMHMLNDLYASSCCGVWRYSPSAIGLSVSRTSHGFTVTSFRRKSPMSTTRSRMIGKFRSGSTRIGPGAYAARNVAQVSFGSPFTVIPQLPQTPIRHDQRYDSVPSRRSLM
jgi:hypothetical protein